MHGSHVKSIKYFNNGSSALGGAFAADTGGRFSFYNYTNVLPNATGTIFALTTAAFAAVTARLRMTSTGILQVWDANAQIGTNGATIVAGTWNRITFAWTITSTTVNQFRVYVDGVLSITVSNGTLANTGSADIEVGNASGNTTLDMRSSDHYCDDSSALTDTGNVYVTAKRPFSNGTTNNFTTQIGAGGSGYGTGHAPQVNERPLSTTNGWSMIGAGSLITEEYTIEGSSVGDMNVPAVIDFMGWIYASSALSESATIIVAGVGSSISLTNTNTMFLKVAGSTTYPVGGTDIGIVTSATLTTVSLYECGIIFAFLSVPSSSSRLGLLGVG